MLETRTFSSLISTVYIAPCLEPGEVSVCLLNLPGFFHSVHLSITTYIPGFFPILLFISGMCLVFEFLASSGLVCPPNIETFSKTLRCNI